MTSSAHGDEEEQKSPKTCCYDFRKRWIPGFDSVFSSGTDVASDWIYYYTVFVRVTSTDETDPPDVSRFEIPLIIICVISTLMFLSVSVKYLRKACCDRKVCCSSWSILLTEHVFEDIPQLVVTSMIEIERGGLSLPGLFSITTSGFNLIYKILNLLMPNDIKKDS